MLVYRSTFDFHKSKFLIVIQFGQFGDSGPTGCFSGPTALGIFESPTSTSPMMFLSEPGQLAIVGEMPHRVHHLHIMDEAVLLLLL